MAAHLIRTLPAPLAIPWRPLLLLMGWVLLNVGLLAYEGVRYLMVLPHDWEAFHSLPGYFADGSLYELRHWFVWSPIAAWLLAYVFVPAGYSLWLGLHLAVVPLLRDWRLIALTVASVPFWFDTLIGNTFTFPFVAGAIALQGSRWGALAYLALCCLMPRPVQAPLALWLLWKQPETRIPFVLMVVATVGVSLAMGYFDDWLAILIALSGANNDHFANFGPTQWLGSVWLVVGIPLAGWLAWKGRVGLAGLAMSPYVLPTYLIVLLWELVPQQRSQHADDGLGRKSGLRRSRRGEAVIGP